MKRRIPWLCTGALAIAMAFALLYAFNQQRQFEALKHEATEGFELKGTYTSYQGLPRSIYFEPEDTVSEGKGAEMRWAARTEDSDYVGGPVSPTSDPNLFTLLDEDRETRGFVHLAYAKGKTGRLYLSLDGSPLEEYKKIDDCRVTWHDEGGE